MARDQFERAFGQFLSWRNFVPWRCAGRMRQWNYIEAVSRAFHSKFARDYLLQSEGEVDSFPYNRCAVDKLHDGQSAHGNDETRSQNPDLIVHP
jgi:hypothetical protein